MKNLSLILLFFFLVISCSRPSPGDYFVYLHASPDKPVISEDSARTLQTGHIQNINRLYKEGKLTAAGPFGNGGGLFFLKARDLSEVQEHLNTDPAIRANRFNIEIHPFIFETGSLCKLDSVYTMTSYLFIQFTSVENKKLAEKDEQMYQAGIGLLDSRIIMEGYFPDVNTRILIADTSGVEAFNEKISALNLSFNNLFRIESRILYIAKGTFCEDK